MCILEQRFVTGIEERGLEDRPTAQSHGAALDRGGCQTDEPPPELLEFRGTSEAREAPLEDLG